MKRVGKMLLVFVISDEGASTISYAVLLGMIVAAAAGGLAFLGSNIQHASSSAATAAGEANHQEGAAESNPQPASKSVFADSFADAKTSKSLWDFNSPLWQVNNHKLTAGPLNGGGTLIAYAKGSSFTNGTITTDFTLTQGWGVAVLFHLSGDPVSQNVSGYSFQYDAGYGTGAFTLYKLINGVQILPPLAITYPPPGYQWYGVPRQIQVTTQGSLITAKVDGQTVISISDSSYSSGGAGLRLWNNPGATFTDFTITTP